ncbi:ATP-binding cassette domain-containing protein [Paenibacillus sp. NPDC057934]|uniref:ATP-binding cassette domain-containing protein n=1 Tax=Paenibacillus sp. NPDC057934 TaxID=3346282 RepID=UPI0036DAB9D4
MQIKLNDVTYTYSKRRRNKPLAGPFVLQHLGLSVESGEMLAIAGKSGSGKSTFLQLLKGFLAPSEGTVELDATDPHLARRPEVFDRVGFIFQYPEHQLFSTTVFEDIAFGLQSAKLTAEEKEVKVRAAMEAVQLDYEQFKDRSPFELSGGEKRRVAIAGVVVLEPEVLILDEPTAGLDLQSRTALFDLLHSMNQQRGMTVMWVSHQLEEILEHASRLIALKEGQFLADGHPTDLLSDPLLLETFGWDEPPALAVTRLLRELGAVSSNKILSPQEAADTITKLLSSRQISV